MKLHRNILISTMLTISILSPFTAHAIPVAVIAAIVQLPFDIGSFIESTISAIEDIYGTLKEVALDKLAWIASKAQIHAESNKIISQIQQGKPGNRGGLFVTNWETFANKPRQEAGDFFVKELGATKKIDPAFKSAFMRSFSNDSRPSAFSQLQSTFKTDVGYNPSEFTKDFSKGGTKGWEAINKQPGNNPYLSYLILQEDKESREARAEQAARDEAIASKGFIGTQDCTTEEAGSGTGEEGTPRKKCRINRPGSTAQTDFSKVLGSGIDTLQQTDELTELIGGAIMSFLSNLRSKGISGPTDENQLEESRQILRQQAADNVLETARKVRLDAEKALDSLEGIWRIKVKTLDEIDEVDPGVLFELNRMRHEIDSGLTPSCVNVPNIADSLEGDIEDALQRKQKLIEEVRSPGTYKLGGYFATQLSQEQNKFEDLIDILERAADPNGGVSDADAESARNEVVGSVSDVERLIITVGNPQTVYSQQRSITQERISKHQDWQSCR